MARTYGFVNLLSSFGFSHRWRRACIEAAGPLAGTKCADLMCGMGEATILATRRSENGPASVDAYDFCPAMVARAGRSFHCKGAKQARIIRRDVLSLPREPNYDRIVCSFGLKTLDQNQLVQLAELIAAVLHAGGVASFVEIHVPPNPFLRVPYVWYMRYVIPFIGWLALGNPRSYRWLATYTEDFARHDRFAGQLTAAGLAVTVRPLFHGCARLYVARKPSPINGCRVETGASSASHEPL